MVFHLNFRKGNAILDGILFFVIITVVAIGWIISGHIYSEINDDMQADTTLSQDAKDLINEQEEGYASLFDGLILFVFLLMWIFVLVASYQVDSHPVFFIVTLILLVFIIIASAYLGNAMEELSQDAELGVTFAQYPVANWILNNLVLVSMTISFSIVIVMYAKYRGVS